MKIRISKRNKKALHIVGKTVHKSEPLKENPKIILFKYQVLGKVGQVIADYSKKKMNTLL